MKYGFIRDEELEMFDTLIPKIKEEFGALRFLEIGTYGGPTVRGVVNRCREVDCPVYAAGVDIEPGKRPLPLPLPDYAFYLGDSLDMWRTITGTFNLLFVDGCHCVNHCMCDFLNYSPMVEVGGYCLLHDTALPDGRDVQDKHPQHHEGQPPSVLGVREGLKKMGLLQGHRTDWDFVREIPSADGTCGMILMKKVKEL